MKCVCGYENIKEMFIEVMPDNDNNVSPYQFFKLVHKNEKEHYSLMYVCPKCGTLKVEIIP
jgi:rubrerythrin